MIIILTKKNSLRIMLFAVLTVVLGIILYSYIWGNGIVRWGSETAGEASKVEMNGLNSFITFNAAAESIRNIEIFDIGKGEVTKRVEWTPSLQTKAEAFLKGITGMYPKIKAIPDKGYIARIPLQPPVKVSNPLLNDYGIIAVSEVFIVFPEQQQPYLLVLDSKNRPLLYNFQGDTGSFTKELGI